MRVHLLTPSGTRLDVLPHSRATNAQGAPVFFFRDLSHAKKELGLKLNSAIDNSEMSNDAMNRLIVDVKHALHFPTLLTIDYILTTACSQTTVHHWDIGTAIPVGFVYTLLGGSGDHLPMCPAAKRPTCNIRGTPGYAKAGEFIVFPKDASTISFDAPRTLILFCFFHFAYRLEWPRRRGCRETDTPLSSPSTFEVDRSTWSTNEPLRTTLCPPLPSSRSDHNRGHIDTDQATSHSLSLTLLCFAHYLQCRIHRILRGYVAKGWLRVVCSHTEVYALTGTVSIEFLANEFDKDNQTLFTELQVLFQKTQYATHPWFYEAKDAVDLTAIWKAECTFDGFFEDGVLVDEVEELMLPANASGDLPREPSIWSAAVCGGYADELYLRFGENMDRFIKVPPAEKPPELGKPPKGGAPKLMGRPPKKKAKPGTPKYKNVKEQDDYFNATIRGVRVFTDSEALVAAEGIVRFRETAVKVLECLEADIEKCISDGAFIEMPESLRQALDTWPVDDPTRLRQEAPFDLAGRLKAFHRDIWMPGIYYSRELHAARLLAAPGAAGASRSPETA